MLRKNENHEFFGSPMWITVGDAEHPRFHPQNTWSPKSAQVFHALGLCENGLYNHLAAIFIELPWPWYFDGVQPLAAAGSINTEGNCP